MCASFVYVTHLGAQGQGTLLVCVSSFQKDRKGELTEVLGFGFTHGSWLLGLSLPRDGHFARRKPGIYSRLHAFVQVSGIAMVQVCFNCTESPIDLPSLPRDCQCTIVYMVQAASIDNSDGIVEL